MKTTQILPQRRTSRALLLALAATLLSSQLAQAHPYASGLTNNSGTLSFILNESAESVQVAFDNGGAGYTSTNSLGALAAGTHTFALGAHTNFAIIVSKTGTGIPFQISSDSNQLLNFSGPEDVAVNKNPKTSNFGRIYVVNSNPDVVTNRTSGEVRTNAQGVFLLNADQSDAVGQGDTALTAGMPLDNNVANAYVYVPYRLNIGPDDMVYIGDGRSLVTGTPTSRYEQGTGVWMAQPDFSSGQDLFDPTSTTEFGGITGRPYVTGSMAAGNLVLYALEWDLKPWQSVWQYNIGGGPLPYTTLPTALCNAGISSVNTVGANMAFSPDFTRLYTMEYRGTPGTPSGSGTPLYIWNATNGFANLWQSYATLSSQDPFAYCYGIDISADGQQLLTANSQLGQIELMKLTNSIPDISTLFCVDNSLASMLRPGWSVSSSVRHLAFDAADNIYASSLPAGLVRVYSPGQSTVAITANDWTGTNGTFTLTKSDLSPRATVTAFPDANLDLSGQLVVAEYYGGSAGVLSLGGVPFVNNNARVGGNIAGAANVPNFGTSQDAVNLAKISASDMWQANFNFTVPGIAGHSYKLQLLFHDNYYAVQGKRRFNVTVGGVRLATALDLALAGANMSNPKDIVLTYAYTNTDGNALPIALGQVTDNPMISGLILKDTTPGYVAPPTIVLNPSSVTNLAGQTVSFQAAALGTGVSYQWQAAPYGSTAYTNLINGGRFSGVNSNTLAIANIRATDGLDYVLKANNSAGQALSAPAALGVTILGGVATVAQPSDLGLGVGTVVAAEYYGTHLGPLAIGSTVFYPNNSRMLNNGYTAGFTAPVNTPSFGVGLDATNLALISAMDAWGDNAATLDFTIPTLAGRAYLLKLLFHDNWFNTVGARVFQVNAGPQGGPLAQLGPESIDLVNFGDYQTQPADLLLTLGVTNYGGSPIEVQMIGSVQNPLISAIILQDVSSGTVPPMVSIQPEAAVTLYSGHTTNLFAAVGGSSLIYQWQISTDGGTTWNDLPNSPGSVSGATTPTLTLTVSASVPNALYHLVAHNTAGSVTTTPAAVTVLSGPPLILTGGDLPSTQFARVGQTLNLAVALDGDMPFTCTWQRSTDGGSVWDTVVNGGRFSGATSNVLSIVNAQTNDSAMYRLSVLNDQSAGNPLVSTADTLSVLFGAATFAGTGVGWQMNGTLAGGPPVIANNSYTLTDDLGNENDSGFYGAPVYVGAFHAGFTYQNQGGPEGGGAADGACWVLQNDPSGATYLGGGGGSMGYVGLAGPSFALSFNLWAYDPLARGAPGWTYITNGIAPAAGVNPFRSCSPVSLYDTTPIAVSLLYENRQLTVTMTQGTSVFENVISSIDLPVMLGGNTAFVGFTGSDGGLHSYQIVSDFFFKPFVALSSHLTATNTVVLAWEKNSGMVLESAADLTSGAWTPVPAGEVAGQAVVPLAPAVMQFYRLTAPLP